MTILTRWSALDYGWCTCAFPLMDRPLLVPSPLCVLVGLTRAGARGTSHEPECDECPDVNKVLAKIADMYKDLLGVADLNAYDDQCALAQFPVVSGAMFSHPQYPAYGTGFHCAAPRCNRCNCAALCFDLLCGVLQ